MAATLVGMPAAQAAPRAGDPALNFQGMVSRYVNGLGCHAVPTTDGGTMSLVMSVDSDSSQRVADVTYYLGAGPFLSNDGGYPMGSGKIMVVAGEQSTSQFSGQAERPGPPASKRDSCSYGNPNGSGTAQVVHLQPVTRPSAGEVQAWCETQSWYQYAPYACPA